MEDVKSIKEKIKTMLVDNLMLQVSNAKGGNISTSNGCPD